MPGAGCPRTVYVSAAYGRPDKITVFLLDDHEVARVEPLRPKVLVSAVIGPWSHVPYSPTMPR